MVIFTVKVTIVDTDTSLALPVHCVPLYICALPQVLCQTEPRGQFGRSAGRRCACSPTLVYSHQGRGVTWVPGGEPGPSCGQKGDCKGNCVPTGQQGLKRDSETEGGKIAKWPSICLVLLGRFKKHKRVILIFSDRS